jgi:hypothetical protein
MSEGEVFIAFSGNCLCGAELPWHLLELGLTSHTCSCGRVFTGGKIGVTQSSFDQAWKDHCDEPEDKE